MRWIAYQAIDLRVMRIHHGQQRVANGYTLLELMIVLAILVTVMAVAWPNIARRLKIIGPREAALQVKSDLAEAREEAIRSGEAWALRIERGGARYEFGPVRLFRQELLRQTMGGRTANRPEYLPWETTEETQSTNSDATSLNAGDTATVPLPNRRTNELPPGLVFDDGFAHGVSDANQIKIPSPSDVATPSQTSGTSVALPMQDNWKVAVIYQPDGRATESEIRLKDQATENSIRLRVRRFTGGVSLDKVERKPKTIAQPSGDEFLPDEASRPAGTPSVQDTPPTFNAPPQVAPQTMERR